jgi:hypothetical protein
LVYSTSQSWQCLCPPQESAPKTLTHKTVTTNTTTDNNNDDDDNNSTIFAHHQQQEFLCSLPSLSVIEEYVVSFTGACSSAAGI